jgi:hypothetical protein
LFCVLWSLVCGIFLSPSGLTTVPLDDKLIPRGPPTYLTVKNADSTLVNFVVRLNYCTPFYKEQESCSENREEPVHSS